MGELYQSSVFLAPPYFMARGSCALDMRFVPPLMSMPNVSRLPDSWAKFAPKTFPAAGIQTRIRVRNGRVIPIQRLPGTPLFHGARLLRSGYEIRPALDVHAKRKPVARLLGEICAKNVSRISLTHPGWKTGHQVVGHRNRVRYLLIERRQRRIAIRGISVQDGGDGIGSPGVPTGRAPPVRCQGGENRDGDASVSQ